MWNLEVKKQQDNQNNRNEMKKKTTSFMIANLKETKTGSSKNKALNFDYRIFLKN
jgi:hypothetical protein